MGWGGGTKPCSDAVSGTQIWAFPQSIASPPTLRSKKTHRKQVRAKTKIRFRRACGTLCGESCCLTPRSFRLSGPTSSLRLPPNRGGIPPQTQVSSHRPKRESHLTPPLPYVLFCLGHASPPPDMYWMIIRKL